MAAPPRAAPAGEPISEAEALARLRQCADPSQQYYAAWWVGRMRCGHPDTIPLLQRMAAEMGKERFIDMLKSLSTDIGMVTETQEFWSGLLDSIFWTHVITREIIEESDTVLKYNVTECLWAKTFREAEAGDIGFALFCYPDFARARVAHRTLTRTKTLMQGDEHCDFYFEIDARSS